MKAIIQRFNEKDLPYLVDVHSTDIECKRFKNNFHPFFSSLIWIGLRLQHLMG